MATPLSFSNDGESVIGRKLNPEPLPGIPRRETGEEVAEFFELDRCVAWVKANDFKKVSLL
jgi:hypothetical protein